MNPVTPGGTIGILGGGQLGRMLAIAAAKLGLRAHILAPETDSAAFDVAASHTCAAYEDIAALKGFAGSVSVVTYEFENIPALSLAAIEDMVPVYPPRRALVAAQDRLAERRLLDTLRIPHAPFTFVSAGDVLAERYRHHSAAFGPECFLKKIRTGYDGKGQLKLGGEDQLPEAAVWLGNDAALIESAIRFTAEVSVIAVRDAAGHAGFYDIPENVHRNGILRESVVPARVPDNLISEAHLIAEKIMRALDYVGVIAVEMFVVQTNENASLLVNEIAPRVHNSGHWTLDACAVNQFENHIRAVAGWSVGSTARHSDARMVNLIGPEAHDWQRLLQTDPARSLHLYGKGDAREGRKMGHYCDLFPLTRANNGE